MFNGPSTVKLFSFSTTFVERIPLLGDFVFDYFPITATMKPSL
jgi:hypothetical protein